MRKLLLIPALFLSTVLLSQVRTLSSYDINGGGVKLQDTVRTLTLASKYLRPANDSTEYFDSTLVVTNITKNAAGDSFYVWKGEVITSRLKDNGGSGVAISSFGKNTGRDSIILLLSDGTRYAAKDSVGSGGGGGTGWLLPGNAGTNPGTDYIGTSDAKDVVFKRGGVESGRLDSTLYNTSWGYQSLLSNTTGIRSAAFGYRASTAQTTAQDNVSVGVRSQEAVTTGSSNVGVGSFALQLNVTSNYNTAVGTSALANTTGGSNTGIGSSALSYNTTGTQNTAVGYQAMIYNTTGGNNTAVGMNTLLNNGTSSGNTGVGFSVLSTVSAGNYNTAMGQQSFRLATGNNNTGYGFQSGVNTSTGTDNFFGGYTTGNYNTTGSFNTYAGSTTGMGPGTGNYNTIVGAQVDLTALSTALSNQVILADGQGKKAIWGNPGATVTSASSITPLGTVCHVTGTTSITTITASKIAAGAVLTLIFDGALTISNGTNMKLAGGTFTTSANSTISLAYDGTNFYETARSVN